jgi:hypothetical protein
MAADERAMNVDDLRITLPTCGIGDGATRDSATLPAQA